MRTLVIRPLQGYENTAPLSYPDTWVRKPDCIHLPYMQHEPRPAIHMGKQLESAHKLAGAESLGISKAGQTALPRLMESQIWHQLAGSVRGGFRKGTMACAHLDARHFRFSL